MAEENKRLKFRMYGLVNYQLTGMQGGIQFGHATDQFAAKVITAILNNPGDNSEFVENYIAWVMMDKAVVVLDGGSTNLNPNKLGTLNKYMETLKLMNVYVVPFYEEDLGDQLLSFAFLLDERVWDKVNYPDFDFVLRQTDRTKPVFSSDTEEENWKTWVGSIGGIQNNNLREFIRPLRLAN